jgi:deazaflavin-dependent oxidoreductase (nitroreductase family)
MGQMPTVLLTTTGRKSGRPHTVPLGAIEDGGGWVVIASNSGKPEHPNWWLNLVANPEASLEVGDNAMKVRMQEITDAAERQRVWAQVVGTMKGYARYENKTSRVIPLGRLRPVV